MKRDINMNDKVLEEVRMENSALNLYKLLDENDTDGAEYYSAEDIYKLPTEDVQKRLKALGVDTAAVVAYVNNLLHVTTPIHPAQHLYAILEVDEEDMVFSDEVAGLSRSEVSERLSQLGIDPQSTCDRVKVALSEKQKIHHAAIAPLRRTDCIKHQDCYLSGKSTRAFRIRGVAMALSFSAVGVGVMGTSINSSTRALL